MSSRYRLYALHFFAALLALLMGCTQKEEAQTKNQASTDALAPQAKHQRWTAEGANAWYAAHPKPAGFHHIPRYAINQLEMWQQDSFDMAVIDEELGWAPVLGFDVLQQVDAELAEIDAVSYTKRDINWRRMETAIPEKMANTATAPRIAVNFNEDWRFNYFPAKQQDLQPTSADFDDSAWPMVSVPHTWSTFETTGDIHPFIQSPSERDDPYWWKGWGVYRKEFTISNDIQDRLVRIELDGVQKYSQIWLNGEQVGEHRGGYTSFYFDLTPHLNMDAKNTLVVYVNNERNDPFQTPPMSAGNWNLYGGIYRDVRLVVTEPINIPYQGSYRHEGGVFIKTPEVSAEKAALDIATYVQNAREYPQNIDLQIRIIDNRGREIAKTTETSVIDSGTIAAIESNRIAIRNPLLWSPDMPNLYTAEFSLSVDDVLKDVFTSRFGLRWFRWDNADNALYLNDRRIRINGTNRHQEFPWLGDAIPHWITYYDMRDIKQGLGHNFIRAAHYPNDPYLYQLTDEMGLIVVEEVPNNKSQDFNEALQQQHVIEMIRRDRNHPSILFWSMGNETTDPANPAWAKAEDGSRIVHTRKGEGSDDDIPPDHSHLQLDLENLLRVSPKGLFDYGLADIQATFNPQHGQHAGSEEWQHRMAQVPDGSIRGSMEQDVVVWLYNDHGADREYLNSPLKHVNPKGWVDLYRAPKHIYYLWRAAFIGAPVIYAHDHHWRKDFVGQHKSITLDTNCASAGLFVGDMEIGRQTPAKGQYSMVFDRVLVANLPLKAMCYSASGEVLASDISPMPGVPYQLLARASHSDLIANRADVAIIEVEVADIKGTPNRDARHSVKWEINGPATLVGPNRFQSDQGKIEAVSGYGYLEFPVSNLVRSTGETGDIQIRVSADGLQPAIVKLTAVENKDALPSFIALHTKPANLEASVRRIAGFTQIFSFQQVIQPIRGNVKLMEHESKAAAENAIKALIHRNNPDLHMGKEDEAFTLLTDNLAQYLVRMRGDLIADDFNFEIAKYNDFMNFSRFLAERDLHKDYAKLLRVYYQDQWLVQNSAEQINELIARFSMVPSDHLFVSVTPTDGKPRMLEKESWHHRLNIAANNLEQVIVLVTAYAASQAVLQENWDIELSVEALLVINPYLEEWVSGPTGNFSTALSFAVSPLVVP